MDSQLSISGSRFSLMGLCYIHFHPCSRRKEGTNLSPAASLPEKLWSGEECKEIHPGLEYGRSGPWDRRGVPPLESHLLDCQQLRAAESRTASPIRREAEAWGGAGEELACASHPEVTRASFLWARLSAP